MQQKTGISRLGLSKGKWITVFALVVTIATLALIIHLAQPKRSAAAFCETYKQEDAQLTKVYGSTAFSQGTSNPYVYVSDFAKLDRVAPTSIEPDVSEVKKTFQSIKSNPSQALSASLAGLPAETAVASWAQSHCGK